MVQRTLEKVVRARGVSYSADFAVAEHTIDLRLAPNRKILSAFHRVPCACLAHLINGHHWTDADLNGLATQGKPLHTAANMNRLIVHRQTVPSRRQLPGAFLGLILALSSLFMQQTHAESLDGATKRGHALLDSGHATKAIAAYKQALDLAIKTSGTKSANAQRIRHNLARAYEADSQFAQADQLYRESFEGMLAARKNGRGQVTVDEIADMLQNWANYDHSLGQLGEAEAKTRQALEIYEAEGMTDSASVSRYNLAGVLTERKEYQKASAEYDNVLRYRLDRFGPNDTRYSNALEGPGVLCMKVKDFTNAEKFFRKRLAVSTASYGADSDTDTMENLAMTLKGLGQFQEAQQLFERYLALATKIGLPERVASTRSHLADIAAYKGEWGKALDLANKSQRFMGTFIRHVALGLSDAEVLGFLPVYLADAVDDSISIAWTQHDNPVVAEMSAGWSINGRGLHYAAMAERLLLARDVRLNGQAALFDELVAVRRQHATLLQNGRGEMTEEDHARQLIELSEREGILSRQIGLTGQRTPLNRSVTEVSVLRKALPADTALIHLAKIGLRDFTFKGGPAGPKINPHYIAWIVPPAASGDVKMLKLGTAAEIEAAAQKLAANFKEIDDNRNDLNEKLEKIDKGDLPADEEQKAWGELFAAFRAREGEIEKSYRETATADLSRLLLHPLLTVAGPFKKWILCPDADLWLTPWNALVLPDGRYLIEEHTLSHVVSPTALVVANAEEKPAPGPPLVMSAPNYDLGITGPQDRAWNVGLIHGFGSEWVDTLLPHFQAYAGAQARVYIGDTATEEVVKQSSSPRLLFLTTHGSFGTIDPAKMPPGFGFLRENPLLRCDLVFAGCNRKRSADDTSEDGFLFGSEVLGCDLRGTDLVVLTACQTAQGDVHAGQSAAGMRQAFQLAGARDVIATLWSVDQQASKKLVNKFAASLAERSDPTIALREAQLAVRHNPETAHPFYWAAFTITGRRR